jgi:hypothetical protein
MCLDKNSHKSDLCLLNMWEVHVFILKLLKKVHVLKHVIFKCLGTHVNLICGLYEIFYKLVCRKFFVFMCIYILYTYSYWVWTHTCRMGPTLNISVCTNIICLSDMNIQSFLVYISLIFFFSSSKRMLSLCNTHAYILVCI